MTNKAFTLIELLIVLVLMGIVYAVVFQSMARKSPSETEGAVTVATLDRFLRHLPDYGRKPIDLVCSETMRCYVVVDGNVTDAVAIPSPALSYRLNPDETLQVSDWPHVQLRKEAFVPACVVGCDGRGQFRPAILRSVDRWYLLHPIEGMKVFASEEALIAFVHQSDYLPDRAGYAR